ncbi:MAG: hypothetical protein J6O56_02215 [Bacilli bacterium]|nr:hypothetical protein [Bacilli bacterium]
MNTIEENQLLEDYINGTLDLELCTKLESSSKFMKLVFMKTRDTNYYKFCSKSLKNDYDFLMFLIKLFNSENNFIYEIITHYLFYDVNHDDKYINVLTLAEKMFRYNVDKDNYVYYMRCRSRIADFMQTYENHANYIMNSYNRNSKDKNTIGFLVAMNEYKEEPQILEFLASNYVYGIFTKYNLEEYIHYMFNTKEEVLLCDQKELILSFINKIDYYLAEFVKNKEELLYSAMSKLNHAIYNYDSYEDNTQVLVDRFNIALNNYLIQNSIEYTYKIDMLKIEEVKKMGLEAEFYSENVEVVDFLKASDDDPIIFLTRKFIREELEKLFKVKMLKKVR